MDLDRLVRAQHGVCTTQQALVGGLSVEALRWKVASGRWQRLGRELYVAQTGPLDWLGRAHALVLRGGPGVALSLDSAAHLHGVRPDPPPVITLWVPRDRRMTRLPGSRVAQRSDVEVVVRRGLPVTSAARTALDLADVPGTDWRGAVATAARWVQRRKVTATELGRALDARPRHAHRRTLRLALGIVDAGAESLLEVGYVRDVERRHGLPSARLQVPGGPAAARLRRDAEYEDWKVVVELDGRLGHEGEHLAVDRRRDRDAAREGRLTLRAGWVDVDRAPCRLAVDVHETLRSRGWRGLGRACGPRCPLHHALVRAV
ncbi:type IV toxin-antitoxin system AbiEi family antitoxin domain-containing protein [Phycicoccus flavus]|uniref:type IV toxin-antitoxin system AbiEi family antitoxin domain-containing protein n=1 Tax=Phycicoccus flavus TaxID=2502783 RepID=UPI000FEB742D|nr:type IV toxin-antitoxin system AbiEi family antitoxin domain-containing protein [Phycicoccus flavus]NHA68428.1 hypothetical protein [Phycicoccus flavus]